MTNVTSDLILQLKDGVSAGAKEIAASLEKVAGAEKAIGKQSAEMQKLSDTLDRAKKALGQTGAYKANSKALNDASVAMRAASQTAAKLASEMSAVDKPTRSMQQALKVATGQVSATREAFAKQGQAVRSAAEAVEKFGIPLKGIARAEADLKKTIDLTTQAIKEQSVVEESAARAAERAARMRVSFSQEAARAANEEAAANRKNAAEMARLNDQQKARRREMMMGPIKLGAGYAGMILGGSVTHAAEDAVKQGATVQERIAMLQAGGAQMGEIDQARSDFRTFSRSHSGVLEADYLAGYKDARVIAPAEAHEMAGYGALYRSALRNSGLSASDHDIGDAMRVMDELALKNSSQRLDFINNLLKTQQTFGDQVPVSTLLAATRNAKQSVYGMSPDFMNKYLPTILQSAGQNGGTEIMTAYNNYIGEHMTHAEMTALARNGFINKRDLEYDKTGKIKSVRQGAQFYKEDEFKSNIAQWSWDFHKDFMARKGSTEEGFDKLVATMPRNMAALIAFLVHNEDRMKRDADTRDKATGIDAANDDALTRNPIAGLNALREAIEQFGASMTSPMMAKVGAILQAGASTVQNAAATYADWAKNNPGLSQFVGNAVVGGGLLGGGTLAIGGGGAILDALKGGFGLKGSAVALTGSAEALNAAAGRLGAAGAVGNLPGIGKNASITAEGPGFWKMAASVIPLAIAAYDMLQLKTKEDWNKRLNDNVENDKSINKWLIDNVPGMKYMDGGWRDQNLIHGNSKTFAGTTDPFDQFPDHGLHAGTQTGQSIAEGLKAQTPAILAAASSILKGMQAAMAGGVTVPVKLAPTGVTSMQGVHSDVGVGDPGSAGYGD